MDTLSHLPALTTQRLHIRPLRVTDAQAVQSMTNHRVITECVHFLPTPFDHAAALKLLENQKSGHDLFWGAWLTASSTLVAIIGTHLHGATELEIGYWVNPVFQRQGIAQEATSALIQALRHDFSERQIIAECRPANVPSSALLQKLGFTPTHQDGLRPGRKKFIFKN